MPDLGKMNTMTVLRVTDIGLFLDGQGLGDVLLPRRYASREWGEGDSVEVFLMRDSDDRPMATTLTPHAMAGEFAYLKVVSVTPVGAFLDWGLPKDLLVPFREQKVKMLEGRSYVVKIYVDEVSGRIAASSRLERFLAKTPDGLRSGQPVKLLVAGKSDLGYMCIIDGTHMGMLFYEKVVQELRRGEQLDGFIELIREDGKIGLSLQKPGYGKVPGIAEQILAYLDEQGGFMPVSDKSSREEIHALFGVSKKTFKKAIGALYKARKIAFENGGTKRVEGKDG